VGLFNERIRALITAASGFAFAAAVDKGERIIGLFHWQVALMMVVVAVSIRAAVIVIWILKAVVACGFS
jgi:hypothetical protein